LALRVQTVLLFARENGPKELQLVHVALEPQTHLPAEEELLGFLPLGWSSLEATVVGPCLIILPRAPGNFPDVMIYLGKR
jgi:hypothetical protein